MTAWEGRIFVSCGALYLHIPFCKGKCPYCDFYSIPYTGELAEQYTMAVCRALQRAPFPLGPLETVYFGGGTPSLLTGEQIGRILETAAKYSILPGAEITVECNPGTVTADGLLQMRAAGVNRLSLGLQSADDALLQTLGRRHNVQEAAQAAAMARSAGFEHFSFDLMLALPGQNEEQIIRAVRFCRAQGAEHVSAYLLKIEEGTPFARDGVISRCPDEDGQAALYLFAARALESHGFFQYEISNFAREGRVARHNLKYWNCEEYLGLGPSAHSFCGGRRFYFPSDAESFLAAEDVYSLCEDDGPGGGSDEYLMLRLRLAEGVVWDALEARYPGMGLRESLTEAAALLEGTQLVEVDERGLRLTLQGMLVSNSVIAILLPDSAESPF